MKIELDPFEELQELTQRLNYYRDAYYNKDFSIISDEEYDRLYDRLIYLEELVGVKMENSPTESVGYEVVSELIEVDHNHPMLSLDKTKEISDLVDFIDNKPCVIMPKMDGLTCTLRYIDGKLESAETRGNGHRGELITHNARVIKNIPQTIDTSIHEVIVDGELVITYADFNRINDDLRAQGVPEEKLFANPRNMASGTARQLNSKICADRNLKFVAWRCVKGSPSQSFSSRLAWLKALHFEVVNFIASDTYDKYLIEEFIKDMKYWAESKDYKIDGAVIGYDDIAYGEALGYTKHHPRNQIAFKFYDETYPTILRSVEWSVGKTGAITPIAHFDTVEIDGTKVSKASMHNLSVMQELHATIGDTCYVYKANMIIPQIDHFDSFTCTVDIPLHCPCCGWNTFVDYSDIAATLYCTNPNCKSRGLGKLETFVSKPAMNIDGLSSATLEIFYDKGWVRSFADIYKLYEYGVKIEQLPGFGEKSVMKLLDSIDHSRKVKLDNFITALSIPNIAGATATAIAEFCGYDIDLFITHLNNRYSWSIIDGVGDKTSRDINNWWINNSYDVCSFIDELDFIKPEIKELPVTSPISGKTFCITGTFSESRDILKEKIQTELGAKFVSSVGKNTDILFVGEKAGSKLKKAKDLGITIYDEQDLKLLLEV